MKRIAVEVLSSTEALRRMARAWSTAKKGGKAEPTIGVSSIGELSALLSPRRMELLRFVAENGGLSVRALAKAIGRDYKNVHSDVAALEARHLLGRDEERGIISPYDEIVIRAPLRDAA